MDALHRVEKLTADLCRVIELMIAGPAEEDPLALFKLAQAAALDAMEQRDNAQDRAEAAEAALAAVREAHERWERDSFYTTSNMIRDIGAALSETHEKGGDDNSPGARRGPVQEDKSPPVPDQVSPGRAGWTPKVGERVRVIKPVLPSEPTVGTIAHIFTDDSDLTWPVRVTYEDGAGRYFAAFELEPLAPDTADLVAALREAKRELGIFLTDRLARTGGVERSHSRLLDKIDALLSRVESGGAS